MTRKKTAAKARPKGRNKPAAKPVKKAVKKAKKVVKAAPTKRKPVKKVAIKKAVPKKKVARATPKKSAKRPALKAVKAKPAKAIKKVAAKPVKARLVVVKHAPLKTTNKVGTVKKPVAVAKAAPVKPVKLAPVPVAKPMPVAKAVAKAPALAEPKVVVLPKPAPKPVPVPVIVKKPLKERVTIEFMVQSSPAVLYEMISSPSGFAEWYCQDVNTRGDQWTFIWPDEQEATTMIGRKLGEVIRFHRNDDDDEASYFEFRVRIDAMTNEVALIVTDHAWPAEIEETRNLWASQISSLLRVLGA